MVRTGPARLDLPIGNPARAVITRALLGSVLLALVFWVVIEVSKGLDGLYRREPWQDDPYDAMVSFMLSAVPFWTALCALRIPLSRPGQPLPVRRALDLVRAQQVQVVLIGLTLGSEWVSVALGQHRDAWNAVTGLLIAALAGLTLLSVATWFWLRLALSQFRRFAAIPAQPDWITDVLDVGQLLVSHLGPGRGVATTGLRCMEVLVANPLRRHPLRTTGILSLLAGVIVSLPQIILEGYPPGLAVLFVVISAASMFAFLVIAGAHLQVVAPRRAHPAVWVRAAVLTALAVPLAAAFRDAIWVGLAVPAHDQTVAGLAVLCLGAGLIIGLVVLVADILVRYLRA